MPALRQEVASLAGPEVGGFVAPVASRPVCGIGNLPLDKPGNTMKEYTRCFHEVVKPLMKQEVQNEIKSIAARVAAHTAARRIILFGSYAAGTQKKDSDLDICVITDDKRRKVDILRELNRTVGYESTIPLDIVVYSTREFYDRADSSTSLESRILKTGIDIHP